MNNINNELFKNHKLHNPNIRSKFGIDRPKTNIQSTLKHKQTPVVFLHQKGKVISDKPPLK